MALHHETGGDARSEARTISSSNGASNIAAAEVHGMSGSAQMESYRAMTSGRDTTQANQYLPSNPFEHGGSSGMDSQGVQYAANTKGKGDSPNAAHATDQTAPKKAAEPSPFKDPKHPTEEEIVNALRPKEKKE